MQYKGLNLCDFCFEPLGPGNICTVCGLSDEKYQAEAGLLIPRTNLLGKYIIGRVLGRGGFGVTYLAYSSKFEKAVALKEYFPVGIANRAKGEENISVVSVNEAEVFEKGARRFLDEAKTISKFNDNKNIVSVYEFFYANNTAYYSMEYLDGIDLKKYVSKRNRRLNEAEAVNVMKSIGEALNTIHGARTLHRDISPDNIFICTNGDVKLIDFGAAKEVIGNVQYSVVVKPNFAPIEQYKSTGKQGAWTDIYALGASVYYAVTGDFPTDAMSRLENPDITFDHSPELSPEFKEIVLKCLQFRAEDRYQSVEELLNALNELDVQDVKIGGDGYVNEIYSGPNISLHGETLDFGGQQGSSASGANRGMGNGGYGNYANNNAQSVSQIPNGDYGQPRGYDMRRYGAKKEKDAMIKGIMVGVLVLVIIALLVLLIVTIMQPPVGSETFGGLQGEATGNMGLLTGCVVVVSFAIVAVVAALLMNRKK